MSLTRAQVLSLASFVALTAAPAAGRAQGLGPFWGDGATIPLGDGEMRSTGWQRSWLRVAELAPGSTVEGRPEDVAIDFGLREAQLLAVARVLPELTVALGGGVLDLGPASGGTFRLTEGWADVALVGDALRLGAGLHGWAAISRASSGSTVAPIGIEPLAIAAPLRGATTDAFDRRLGGFAHGVAGGLAWRFAASRAHAPPAREVVEPEAVFVADGGDLVLEGYARWAFGAPAPDALPYHPGSWLGAERTAGLGAGLLWQPDATASVDAGQTRRHDAWIASADLFVDWALPRGAAITLYALYLYESLGPDAVRLGAALDRATSAPPGGSALGAPIAGTGHHGGLEAAYLVPGILGPVRLQVWAKGTAQVLEAVDDALFGVEAGVTLLALEPHLRVTLAWRLRPPTIPSGPRPSPAGDPAQEATLQLLAFF